MADPIKPDPAVEPGGQGGNPTEMVPKSQLDSVVEELKVLRTKKPDTAPVADVDKKIAEALKAKELEEADKTWERVQKEFVTKHKEFHPDNDPGGVKRALLDKELKFFSREGLTSSEDLTSILERARVLAQAPAQQFAPVRIDPSLPRTDPSPRASDTNGLDPKEQRMIAALGWTPERYLKLKAKDPAFVERALRNSPTI